MVCNRRFSNEESGDFLVISINSKIIISILSKMSKLNYLYLK